MTERIWGGLNITDEGCGKLRKAEEREVLRKTEED